MIWLDGHDGPLTQLLEMVAVEIFDKKQQTVEASPDFTRHKYGFARPDDLTVNAADLPFRYPWKDTYEALQKLAVMPGDPYNGVHLRYVNPRSLNPALHTIGCEIQMFRAKEKKNPTAIPRVPFIMPFVAGAEPCSATRSWNGTRAIFSLCRFGHGIGMKIIRTTRRSCFQSMIGRPKKR